MLLDALRLREAACVANAESRDVLLEGASLFLRAGGILTLGEFSTLTPVERAALTSARKSLRVEEMLMQASANGDDLDRARLMGELDGGATLRQLLVERMADRMEREENDRHDRWRAQEAGP